MWAKRKAKAKRWSYYQLKHKLGRFNLETEIIIPVVNVGKWNKEEEMISRGVHSALMFSWFCFLTFHFAHVLLFKIFIPVPDLPNLDSSYWFFLLILYANYSQYKTDSSLQSLIINVINMQIVFPDVFSHWLTRLRCFGWVFVWFKCFCLWNECFQVWKQQKNNKLNGFTI